ncbi:MFS transporter [Pararhodospirillum oryzae]|nr:MFS transporter [Pararhodospirillum oryzae]
MSLPRRGAFMLASALLWTTQGLGMNLIATNIPQLQGALGATVQETTWLTAVYMAPNVTLTVLLTKIRTQFGLRPFAEVGLGVFLLASLAHLMVNDLNSALVVRFLAGMAAAPLSTLGILYMIQSFPPARRLGWGISLALTCSLSMPPVARMISPGLLDLGRWQGLYTLEVGLALVALTVVYCLPLQPFPRAKVLHWKDFVSYSLIALGLGLVAAVLAVGHLYWWFEAPWIGVCLAVAAVALGIAAAIELNRETPLLNVPWLLGPDMVRFALTLLAYRVVLAEQASGALGLFQALGLAGDQTRVLNAVILAATVAGGVSCGALFTLARVPLLHAVALACIATGAFLDSHATVLTRPDNMLVSQALIAFGAAMFLPSAMSTGLANAFKRGPEFFTSFIAVFLFTQGVGGLLGSAVFGTFVKWRESIHLRALSDAVTLTDPRVVERLHQLAGAYRAALPSSAARQAEGLAGLAGEISRQASLLAYNEAFFMIGVGALGMLACVGASLVLAGWLARRALPSSVS